MNTARPASRTASAGRVAVLLGLAGLAAVSWAWLLMTPMPMPDAAHGAREWRYVTLSALMWVVMMIAMMAPSVTPTVLLFDRVARQGPADARGLTLCFVAGYFSVWLAFALAATLLQVVLIEHGIVDAMGAATRPWIASALLGAAAVYQFLPVKGACLQHCRSPVDFLVRHRRSGRFGAWNMGVWHGTFCLGCCWPLMLLLFVGGVMNLLWVAGLSAAVIAEKLAPFGHATRWVLGAALLAAALVPPLLGI